MADKKKVREGYGIGAVARITGLTDHTIRVWERRYEAVVAKRTESGRRVYSAANVEKLGLLKQLTDKGISISKIAAKSNAALRKAALEYTEITSVSLSETLTVAVLGDLIRARLLEDSGSMTIVVADNSPETFAADLGNQPVDAVILEVTILDRETLKQLNSYVSRGRARCGLIVYNFGRKGDIERAAKSGVLSLRSPVGASDIEAAIRSQAARTKASTSDTAEPTAQVVDDKWRFSGTVAPRRFDKQQLVRLANISSTIDCECPQNLAQLVSDLTAFEIYSAQCANRDAEDAALHHYLHQTCAEARELIEIALQKVVEAEGISI